MNSHNYMILHIQFIPDWVMITAGKQHIINKNNNKENSKRINHIYKKGDNKEPSNFRMTALSCTFGKIFHQRVQFLNKMWPDWPYAIFSLLQL